MRTIKLIGKATSFSKAHELWTEYALSHNCLNQEFLVVETKSNSFEVYAEVTVH